MLNGHFAVTHGEEGGPELVDMSGTLIGGKLYMFGGKNPKDNVLDTSLSNRLYVYEFQNDWWSTLEISGEAPMPRINSAVCLAKDKLYVVGGAAPGQPHRWPLNTACLDLVLQEWSSIHPSSMLGYLRNHTATFLPDRNEILLFGTSRWVPGYISGLYAFQVDSHRIYEPKTKGQSPCKRRDHCAGRVGKGMYIVGGFSKSGRQHLTDLFILTPVGDTKLVWSSPKLAPTHSQPSGLTRSASTIVGDYLVMSGGRKRPSNNITVLTFNFLNNTWGELGWVRGMRAQGENIRTDPLHRRFGHIAVAVEKHRILVFGGHPLDSRATYLELNPPF